MTGIIKFNHHAITCICWSKITKSVTFAIELAADVVMLACYKRTKGNLRQYMVMGMPVSAVETFVIQMR